MDDLKRNLKSEDISIGIELGSTRIKTVAIDQNLSTVASGHFEWENQFIDGYWTYSINDIWVGLQKSYSAMTVEIKEKYDLTLRKVKSIGVSGMMHGYLAFDQNEDLLVPFRTWRNGNTAKAATLLSEAFQFNIPERWSIAHLYQAILDNESHVNRITYLTTLAGYVHWYLTGEKVLGIGDASGMFPIDIDTKSYRKDLLEEANHIFKTKYFERSVEELLPEIKLAGESGGLLTEEGATLLDPSGNLEAGILMCPPEGDAGTGMVATNTVAQNTGNISAGTSAFAMIVLSNTLKDMYPEIDVVTTPDGSEVAMIHTNNCTSDINDWMNLFGEVLNVMGVDFSSDELYGHIFERSLSSDDNIGGLLSYNYVSGENITNVDTGYPLFIREPNYQFNLANFMKMHLFSAFSTLKIGMDLLKENEYIDIDKLIAHGGIFKTKDVAQQILASAFEQPITVMETASEGGAWGISVLAYYAALDTEDSLDVFLNDSVFINTKEKTLQPVAQEVINFNNYVEKMKKGLSIEQSVTKYLGGDTNARSVKS
ncbi:FGGY-family carbohydrate kinase [Staphylococcus pseudoxylosus]|uniref:xylulokinase n=1 Tax=Staphylococcus pseudoxylosus TaxID=2282419 RepID=UPI002DB623A3|nr:FGGY-family carbohydrate kinase [Staphylococcus pseudoxylosus]MEB6036610.1 FGGY-family carbohydrate kinase [Staphylococcus pseudoxylosus]MEB6061343.1 FGGY-family carbohydrate kinase [Staphylococcus pseudoxylosus]MEB7754637.1 FGGY-family carbohydrate kinase [Staphylococcus pseudoxylosus]MEB7763454.1 FGGY-family carbohydrate kinase [Staphylococcus pseudoxylosus]MEB8085967.1 FGGY-family carbohydrate kinase [Staphylococcus pseudoxylosus]